MTEIPAKEYKIGDKVILHPPGSLDPAHNPLMGKEAVIVTEVRVTDELEWITLQLNSGRLLPVPVKWLRMRKDPDSRGDCY
jgi:hypothetical protein